VGRSHLRLVVFVSANVTEIKHSNQTL
jgi:hypothetical protein